MASNTSSTKSRPTAIESESLSAEVEKDTASRMTSLTRLEKTGLLTGLLTGLDWTGLLTGLDWTGLDWTGLDWTGLDWTGQHKIDR